MAPKKGEKQAIPRFGRVGNSLKMGIVGLPNVGKSVSLFVSVAIGSKSYAFWCDWII
jgi:hypothetical protein